MEFKLVLLLASFTLATVSSDCGFPPSLWCSDSQVARRCGVEKQCGNWERQAQIYRLEAALKVPETRKPVNLTLAYESLCPGCRHFIQTQLWPVYQELKDFLTVDLLPYGNAHEFYNAKSGKWVFECQHGPKECKGNLIESCAIFITKRDESKYLPYIHCLEVNDPVNDAMKCANKTGLDWDRMQECIDGSEGNVYQHAIATETPKHNYVPWVIFNGIHNEEIENRALTNFKKLVCDSIQGPKPAPCVSTVRDQKCWNNHN